MRYMWRVPRNPEACERKVQETLMTEKELLQQIEYHSKMRDHHDGIVKHFQKRLRLLREAVAKKTSEQVTINILERLKQ